MMQASQDIEQLRSDFKNFEKALLQLLENWYEDSWNEATNAYQRIKDDYAHIQDEYEGEKSAQIASNIVRSHLANLLNRLHTDAVEAVIVIDMNTRAGDYQNDFSDTFNSVIDSLPGDKYDAKEKMYEHILSMVMAKIRKRE